MVDVLLVLAGKIATLLAVFLGGVIAARMGGAEVYGGFVSGIALALLLDGVLGTALDLEVVRTASIDSPSRQLEAQRVTFHLKWVFVVSLAVLSLAAVTVFGLDTGSLPVFPALFAALGVLLARSVAVNLQVKRCFKTYSRLDAVQSLLRLAAFGFVGVLGAATAGNLLSSYALVGLAVVAWGIRSGNLSGVATHWPNIIESKRLLTSIGATFLIIACGSITGRGDVLFLSFSVDEHTLAPYGVASQITQLLSQLALYVSVVTQPRILRDQREGKLGQLALANAGLFLLASLVCLVAFQSGLVEKGIVWVFGDGFMLAYPLLQILVIGGLADLLIVPVFMTLAVLTCKRWVAFGESLIAILFFCALGFVLAKVPEDQQLGSVAWIFVGTRLAKLFLYGLLFVKLRKPRSALDTSVEQGGTA